MTVNQEYSIIKRNIDTVWNLVATDLPDYIRDSVPNSSSDVIARQLRKGIAISSFNDFESYVVSVAGQLAKQVNHLQIETHDLPEDIKTDLALNVWDSEKRFSKYQTRETIAERRSQAADSFFSLTRNGPLYLSPLYGLERSNLQFAEIGKIFQDHVLVLRLILALREEELHSKFSFSTCSSFLFNQRRDAARLVVSNSADYFKTVASLRHQCAHEAGFKPDIGQLKSFISGLSYFVEAVTLFAKTIEAGLELHQGISDQFATCLRFDHGVSQQETPVRYEINFLNQNPWSIVKE